MAHTVVVSDTHKKRDPKWKFLMFINFTLYTDVPLISFSQDVVGAAVCCVNVEYQGNFIVLY